MSKIYTSASFISARCRWFVLSMLRLPVLLLALLFLGSSVQAQVLLSESFDGATFPPTGWTVNGTGNNANTPGQTSWVQVPGGTTTATPPYDNSAGPHTGSGMALYNAWDIDAGGVSNLITPAINFASPSGAKVISFWLYRNNGQVASDSVVILINNTASVTGATRLFGVAPSAAAPTTQWQQYTVNVPASFSGTSQYIIFQAQSAYQTDIFLDDVTVTNLLACNGAPTVTLTSSTTATCPGTPFTLTAATGPLSGYTYQFEVSTNGGTSWSNIGTSSASPSYTVANQTAASQYRVTATCASGGSSTSTAVSVSQNPTTSCYCTPSSTSTTYYINNFSTTGGFANISNTGSGLSAGGYGQFLTQIVSQNPGSSVSYNASFAGSGYTYGMAIWVDWNQNGNFNDPGEKVFGSSSYNSTYTGSFTVPATAATGTTRMRIAADYLNSAPSDPCQTTSAYAEYEDYAFNVIALTACAGTPASTITSSITAACSGVPFTLAASPVGQSGLSYQFEVSTNGGTTWSNLGVASASPSRTVASQTTASQYRVTITCAGGGSNTSAVVSISQNPSTSCYCVPVGASSTYNINDFTTTGGLTNISNMGSGLSPGGYGQFLSQVVSQNPTFPVSFNAVFAPSSYTYGLAIWVDWNQNGNFNDPGEKVYSSSTYSGNHSGTFLVPATAATGNTRMRIGADYLSTTGAASPCGNSTYAEYEDYTFNVIPLTPCTGLPAATIASSITGACPNAPFTLTASPLGQSGLTYQFQSSTNGGTSWTNLGTASASPSRTVPTQTVATQYRVYITCNVGGTDTSAPVAVTQNPSNTCYCVPVGATATYSINDFTTTGGITNITNLGSGLSPGGYGQFLSQVVTQFPGMPVGFNAVYAPSSYTFGVAIWVDWNQNGSLTDPGEKVFSSTGYSGSHSGTFTVPATAISGTTRMRVGADYLSGTGAANPCGPSTYAEYEDYTFNVVPLVPCSGPPTLGAIVSNIAVPCVGDSITLSLPNATFDTGIVFRWEYMDATTGGLFATRGNFTQRVFGDFPSGPTDYRVVAKCTLTGDSTITTIFTINPLAPTLPYFEDFESITSNNQLPPCMKATALGTNNLTYIANQSSYNRKNHTPGGSKFASFKYNTQREDYFFTPGLAMTGGISYEISYWYVGDGSTGFINTRTTIGNAPTVAGVTGTLGSINSAVDTSYKKAVYIFTPATSGTYFVGIGNISLTSTGYFSIDDINVEALPPCVGTPTAGTIVSNTPVNCPGSQVELSVTGNTAASFLTYQWIRNGVPITGPGATGLLPPTYLTPPLTTAVTTYQLELTCTSSVTGTSSDTSAPFVITPYTVTVPYLETFESITANNQLPTCFTVTDIALGTYTFTSATGGGSNHTAGGSKYGGFKGVSLDEWMFTPMMTLQAGKTYKFNFWYRTSAATPFPILQAAVASGPSAPQVVALLNAIPNVGNTTYQEFIGLYTPTTTGDFSFGINTTTSTSLTNVMSIDDIGVVELPPCTGMPAVSVTPVGPITLCPTDSFTLTAPLPAFSGLAYQWQYATDSLFTIPLIPTGVTTTNKYFNIAPALTYFYRLQLVCTYTNDTNYSDTVKVIVNTTQYAPLPYLNDLETWVSYCANHDVPSGDNWLQLVKTGNASWRRNDEGSTASWSTPNSGAYTPPAHSGAYSARFHSSKANVTTTTGGPDEGKLDMYIDCNTGPGTSSNKALYFYHISPGGPTNALDVRLSINGGATWTTLASYDSAFDWRLRRLPFVSNNTATIIRFAGRHTATAAGNDIGVDSIFVAPPCTAQPVAGVIGAVSPMQICPGDSAILNLSGTSMAGDLRIDWETSVVGPNGPWTSRTAGPNGGGYSFNSGQLLQTTWVRAKVTCGGTSQSDTTNTIAFTVSVTPATAYASLPYLQNFESWTDRCGLKEIPSANWSNVPSFGNTSWRRDDQGATGVWNNILGGQWWPASPRAAVDSFSARFHNAGATPDGSRGALNLYVDCSNSAADKELRFFVNMSDRTAGNMDSLRIRYSTDGGFTFTRLDSIRGTNGWEQRIYTIPSTSARTIIRFEAVSQSSQKDIGLDYVQVLEDCSGNPVAGNVTPVGKVCPGRNFRLSTTGTSPQGGLVFAWESSTTSATGGFNPVTGGNTPFLTTTITQNTWFRLGVACGPTGTVVYTPATLVELNDTFYCYCLTNPQYPFVTSQYKENIGRVWLKNSVGTTLMSNGLGAPVNNNNTAINAYTNFQNMPATVLYRDSTYGLEVQQISYTTNSNAVVVAWIDFNRDGVFDATERIVNLTTNNSSTPAYRTLGNFTVPANAKPGITGMRVTLQQPGTAIAPTPCGINNGYGETEDYMVELRFAPCSGYPTLNSGTAYISDTSICPGYPVTLWDTGYQREVFGVTRQWQQSVNNGVSWQNVGTPNTDTIDAIVQANTLYRFTLLCNNGVESYSNVVSVNLLPSTICYCASYANGVLGTNPDNSDIGSVSLSNGTFQVGGPHLLNPLATRRWTNYAAAGATIELWADSTYDMDVYHIMRNGVHKDAKVTVFIDYNQNLTFDVNPPAGYPSERVLTAYTSANNYYLDNMQLRIPSQQVLPNGATLMRVILNEDTGPNAASDQGCGTYESGETEDYYVVFRCPTCPTGVQNTGDNISMFSLFPNPTTGIATVKLNTVRAVKDIEMTITNMTGQVLKKETFRQPGTQFSTTVDLKDQPRGVYFVELKADNERIVRKLIVQ